LGGSHGCPGRLWDRFLYRSTRTIVGTMLWTEYRPVIKIGPKGALGSHEIRPIHSAPSLGQSILQINIYNLAIAREKIFPTFRYSWRTSAFYMTVAGECKCSRWRKADRSLSLHSMELTISAHYNANLFENYPHMRLYFIPTMYLEAQYFAMRPTLVGIVPPKS